MSMKVNLYYAYGMRVSGFLFGLGIGTGTDWLWQISYAAWALLLAGGIGQARSDALSRG